MKAAYFYGIGDIRVEEVEKPKITHDEILIKVKACAVCGTDLRILKFGHFKIPDGEKRVLGHEISGVIAEAGINVKGYSIGEKVSIPPNIGCGTCPECINGLNQLCADYEAFGISIDGGFQEYMRIPAAAISAGAVVKFPDSLSFEEAALAESFSCCYNSYDALRARPGDTVLVIGAGPIGNMHIMINKLAGATKVISADIKQERLEKALEFGADEIIKSGEVDMEDAILKMTEGRGADVVIVACSVPEMQTKALDIVAIGGRINFFGGLPAEKEQVLLNTNLIHYKEVMVLGTTGSSLSDFYKALQIIASGKVGVKPLISARYSIDRIEEAFRFAASGEGMKVFVVND